LPAIKQVIEETPASQTAQKLDGLMDAQLQAYEKLMSEHGLTHPSVIIAAVTKAIS